MRAIVAAILLGTNAASAGTMQQDFDAAQALLDAGEVRAAREHFTALLARQPSGSKGRSANLIRARLGTTLAVLGDPEAAQPLLVTAIAGLTRPEDRSEQAFARYRLGNVLEAMGFIDTAARTYRQALAEGGFTPASAEDISIRAGLVRTLIWSAPDEARQLADGLLALPRDKLAAGDTRALIATLRARIDLNNGKPEAARQALLLAAKDAGGALTRSINAADMRWRGDLLIASHLTGQRQEMARYVAYSGAGSLVEAGIGTPAGRPLPGCSPQSTLASDAVAIVEFAIADTGGVLGATPVYASPGSGERSAGNDSGPESLFVQAVRSWSWPVDSIAKAKPFWRQVVRVELRCQTAASSFDPADAAFRAAEAQWEAGQGIKPVAEAKGSDAAMVAVHATDLAAREKSFGAARYNCCRCCGRSNRMSPRARRSARTAAAAGWRS